MTEIKVNETQSSETVILLVDDEDQFRAALSKQLIIRGYAIIDVDNGEDAIKAVRHNNPEVVILDHWMPGMKGVQTLKEIKKIAPEVQVIMLTGRGSVDLAVETGKLDVFHYMQKPCSLPELLEAIEKARQERIYAMVRHEIPHVKKSSLGDWLMGAHNSRPGFIILGLLLFLTILFVPGPARLLFLLTTPKTGHFNEAIIGYSDYRKMTTGQTISEYYSLKAGLYNKVQTQDGKVKKVTLKPVQVAFRARVMIGVLLVAVLFWATGAIPVGITALLVGVCMYFFGIMPPNLVAQAYAKDAVIFIFGVLAISSAIMKTGLDKRIGMLLLGFSTSLKRFVFIFAPLLAVTASFISEHALIAFIVPILIVSYGGVLRAANLKSDKNLAVMMLLMVCFVANIGGPGSPAAGGRNAVMIGILADYGINITFGQWVKCGLPFVPVMALVIALYFYLAFRNKIKTRDINIMAQIKRETEKIGKMTREEYITAFVLILLVLMWTTVSDIFGMGGPVILSIVLLNIFGVLRWRDINTIHWDVVALYASACAMGTGLAYTGAALLLADSFIHLLPDWMMSGTGLCISTSLFTGILTNFMSDGATVAAIGPIVLPMAMISKTSPIMIGLATAFASSFAHMLIIGTPNNAIAYTMAKDPDTGEQLISLLDFFKHGFVVLLLSLAILWGWAFFGYWRLIVF
ncbi:SLC13 family permease [candidate division CSSED10-310 bacterium]|uniref:SLC13 family permease n=1 Tax=candidate division CSSED10-310 bacterium TaxID=2855610 RepID=A0ABV6YT21_UNCC1